MFSLLSLWLPDLYALGSVQVLLEGVPGPQSHASRIPSPPLWRLRYMAAQEPQRLGVCPFCREEIYRRHTLIRYETQSGEEEAWTECPSCNEVVHPE